MTKAEQLVFGLDIGTRSVVGTVGYKKNINDFTILAQKVVEHDTRAMMDGQIHDIGKVAETIKVVKRELERQLGDGTKLSEVCIAAAGRVLKTVTINANVDFTDEITVNEDAIRALEVKGVEKAYAEIKKLTKEEDVNYYCVAYTIIHYYLNGFQITSLMDHKAKRIGADILATFLPDEVIEGLYTAVDKAGLKVANLTLEPIAAMLVAVPEKFRLLNIALVDVGAGTSDICITKDGSIVAYGMIPMAGDVLTETVSTNHLVEFNVAEKIKLEACSKKKSIQYTDIMGIRQKTTPEEVRAELEPVISGMALKVADKIKELNGGKPVSACFIVGGGGKIPGYDKALAKNLGIIEERVALRGEEVLNFVTFPEGGYKKDPTLVTPIGICLNYYENKNNFVFVNLNGDSIKLYDNNRLTVIEAAIAAGFPNEKLFPRRGKALEYTLNGQDRFVRGESGEAAVITVNGNPASASSPINPNDDIKIKESTIGRAARLDVEDIPEYKGSLMFIVNGKNLSCPKFVSANGNLVSKYYEVHQGDKLEILNYYTLEQILEYMDIAYTDNFYVNNEHANKDTKVYDNFKVESKLESTAEEKYEEIEEIKQEQELREEETFTYAEPVNTKAHAASIAALVKENTEETGSTGGVMPAAYSATVASSPAAPSPAAPAAPAEAETEAEAPVEKKPGPISIAVNKKRIMMNGKAEYRLVDVLDYYPFDMSVSHGSNVVMQINGVKASFIDIVKNNDQIDLYWED